jgi:hypothetical protein
MEVSESEFEVTIPPGQLKELTDLVSDSFALDAKVTDLELQVERAKAERKKLMEEIIPAKMASMGMRVIGVPNTEIYCHITPYVHANISKEWPKEQQDAAYQWLEENEHGDLIKNSMRLDFNKEDAEPAKRIYNRVKQMLAEEGIYAELSMVKQVHHGTLTSFIKERLEAGEELPLVTLGATVGEVVKFKDTPDGKKAKSRRKRA